MRTFDSLEDRQMQMKTRIEWRKRIQDTRKRNALAAQRRHKAAASKLARLAKRSPICPSGHNDWAYCKSGASTGRRYCKECNRLQAAIRRINVKQLRVLETQMSTFA